MKQDRLSRCLSGVDSKYIEEAEQYKKKRFRHVWQIASVAACLCFVLVGALYFGNQINNPINTHQPNNGYSVYVPQLDLPERSDPHSEADMIALVVYRGRIYTQAKWYWSDEAVAVSALVGEYLGYAKGNIDEWSNQDEYATEFASSMMGDVYAVNGYSTNFRICIRQNSIDDDGNEVQVIGFLENLNGVGFNTGKDLFGDRMALLENWSEAKSLSHQQWNEGWPDYDFRDLQGVSQEDIDAFISALYAGEFEYNEDGIEYLEPGVFDDPKTAEEYAVKGSSLNQRHLFFFMDDGTVVELRLFKGGYVGYQHLTLHYFVQIPGEVFDTIFNACQ